MDAITLKNDADKANSDRNVDSVSTEDVKKASNENVEALHTKDDTKYSISENMAPLKTEEEVEEVSSKFYICNSK